MRVINLAIVSLLAAQTFTLQNASFADSSDESGSQLLKRGEAAAAAGDWRAAAEDFIASSHAPETKPTALYDLGIAYYHMGRFAEALAAEQQVLAIDDRYVPAYIQIATIQDHSGDLTAAEASLKKALEIQPGSAVAQANLTQVQAKMQAKTNAPVTAVKIFDGGEPQPKKADDSKPIEIVMPSTSKQSASESTATAGDASTKVEITAAADESKDLPTSSAKTVESKSDDTVPAVTAAPDTHASVEPVNTTGTTIKERPLTSSKHEENEAADTTKSDAATAPAQSEAASNETPAAADVPIITVKPTTTDVPAVKPSEAPAPQPNKPSAMASLTDLLNAGKSEMDAAANSPAQKRADASAAVQRSAARKERATDLVTEALVYFNSGAVDLARRTLESALESDPTNAVAHADLGVVMGTQGDFEGQIREERAALALDPKNPEGHLNLAWALAREKSWQEAVGEYDAALALQPGLVEAVSGKAFVLSKLGQDDEAIKLLSEAKDKNTTAAWPCVALSTLYLDQNKNEAAATELQLAIKREPGNTEALKRMAQLNLATKDWKGAVQNYRDALKKQPYDLDAYLGLALAQQKNSDNDGALKSLKMAVELAPANATAHASLSSVLEKMGRAQEAENEARMALQIDPRQQIAQSVLHRVTR
jgi:tetratricopeptide (TPR) repeat protein